MIRKGRIAGAAAIRLAIPVLLCAQGLSREDIENARRYVKDGGPSFKVLTEAELRRSISITAARNYAVLGYNTPEVQVQMPASDNSDYAVVTFLEAKPLDAKGRSLPHELEQGLYNHETHSTEVRFLSPGGKDLVPLARAAGRVKVRYPLAIKTRTVRKGAPSSESEGFRLDGPYVKYDPRRLDLPDVTLSSQVAPLRAYDAEGRRLEFYDGFQKSEFSNGVTLRTIAFWGSVASVCFDTIESWTEIELPFDLPAAPKLPPGREGLKP